MPQDVRENRVEQLKMIKNCYGGGKKRTFNNLKFHTCVGNFYSEAAQDLIKLYTVFEDGMLPFSGAITEQPAKIVDAFSKLEYYYRRERDKLKEDQEREAKRNNSHGR